MLKKRIEQVRFVAIMLIIELKSKQSLISLKEEKNDYQFLY